MPGYSEKNGKKYIQYIPIRVFKKSHQYISKELKNRLENNIIAIRCRAGKPLTNPKLPIKESPELYRIAGHMLGDGSAAKNKTPYYSNKCKELREKFKIDIKIFGSVETYDRKLTVPIVCFQKTIIDILSYILTTSFIKRNHIPKRLFSAKNNLKCAFLQALFDDEGSTVNNLGIGMKSLSIIKEIKKLVESLNLKTGKISTGDICHYFRISQKDISRFKDKIGFHHPLKFKRLNTKIRIQERNKKQRTRPLEWTRNKIISLLEDKPRTTIELSNILLLSITGVCFHLNFMKEVRRIKDKYYKNKRKWYLA